MVQALETPGNCSALSISAIRLSTVTPGRHSSFGLRLMMVSNISDGAGSVAVSGAAGLAVDRRHFRKRPDDPVLGLQQFAGLGDGDAGQRRRHVEQRAFVEVRHELGAELPRRPDRHGEHAERQQDHQHLGAHHALDHRPVDPDQEAVDRVLVLGNDPAAHEDHHQRRHQRHRQQRGRRHRKRLGEGERAEQPAFLRFQREDRHERHRDDQQAEEQRRPDLGRRLDQHVDARIVRARRVRDACARSRS